MQMVNKKPFAYRSFDSSHNSTKTGLIAYRNVVVNKRKDDEQSFNGKPQDFFPVTMHKTCNVYTLQKTYMDRLMATYFLLKIHCDLFVEAMIVHHHHRNRLWFHVKISAWLHTVRNCVFVNGSCKKKHEPMPFHSYINMERDRERESQDLFYWGCDLRFVCIRNANLVIDMSCRSIKLNPNFIKQ